MEVEGIDRVVVAVRDLDVASRFFSDLLGLRFDKERIDEEQEVKYTRSAVGLELVQSISPDGAVARFIEKRGEGLYAIMFKVSDIGLAAEEMQKKGLQMVANPISGGLEEACYHPRDSHGTMIILCQYESKHGATIAESQN